MLEILREKNPQLNILDIFDPAFSKYGRVLKFDHFTESAKYLEKNTAIPERANNYVANDSNLRNYLNDTSPFHNLFGGLELQYGYVNGHNQHLNALEYHKTSEVNIAVTPLVLLLGLASEISDNKFDTKHLSSFYLPRYTAIELFPRTLHFSPCKVEEKGFICGVILPKGTNINFEEVKTIYTKEDKLLFKTNKWLIGHKDNINLNNTKAHIGIIGPNYKIEY
jgi:hypothetical protein